MLKASRDILVHKALLLGTGLIPHPVAVADTVRATRFFRRRLYHVQAAGGPCRTRALRRNAGCPSRRRGPGGEDHREGGGEGVAPRVR